LRFKQKQFKYKKRNDKPERKTILMGVMRKT
jgi:hypothetical protein